MQKNRLGNFPTRFIIEPKKIAEETRFFLMSDGTTQAKI